jgi:hypothetical protein
VKKFKKGKKVKTTARKDIEEQPMKLRDTTNVVLILAKNPMDLKAHSISI